MWKSILTALIVVFSIEASGQEDAIVVKAEYKVHGICNSDTSRTSFIYHCRKDIMRLDLRGPFINSSIIYHLSEQKVYTILHPSKEYYVVTKEEMDRENSRAAQIGIDLQKEFDAMSPELQALSADIWNGGNPVAYEEPVYVIVKKADSLISQMLCRKYVAKLKRNKEKIMWSNDFKYLGLKHEELAILSKFSNFMGRGTKSMAGDFDMTFFNRKSQSGYPVLIQNKSGTQVCNSLLVKQIYRIRLPDKFFKIPADYGQSFYPFQQ